MFVDMASLAGQDIGVLDVILFQEASVRLMPTVRCERFFVMVTGPCFSRLRAAPPVGYETMFEFEQHPGFDTIAGLAREEMVMLNQRLLWAGELPFPDMRGADPDRDGAIFEAIRAWGETPPCPRCGSLLPRGLLRDMCCRGFEEVIHEHLPPPIPAALLARVVRQTEKQPNFPRVLNQGMRPVMHHADMRYPRGGGSTMVVTGMPYGVSGVGQFKTTVYAVFSGQGNMDVPDETEKTALVAGRRHVG
jgi:hypothetical protein